MGAPLPGNLDWDNDELLNTPMPPFRGEHADKELRSPIQQRPVKWRVLPSLPVIDSAKDLEYHDIPGDPAFLTTHQLAINNATQADQEDSALSQFYDHSFAVHETSEISVSGLRVEYSTEESDLCEETMDTMDTSTTSSSGLADAPGPAPLLRIPRLSDLQDLPTARYLESIAPQTMTVNLIAGVIAVQPRRRVVTRRWEKELDIIELVVGDETRTGFAINFWLPPKEPFSPTHEGDDLGQSLATLRPQDLVLLRTVGLSSFQNRVYGQSLRRGMTQIELLYRRPVDAMDAGGFYKDTIYRSPDQVPPKVCRVRDWVLQFVGATDQAGGGTSGMFTQRGQLPPDTQ